ncbi:hypothetical protein KI387_040871 [Taxus chinensis]|uniref:Fe2OG dioxygenase domain-containing protein n=1 Tax=Taxus chinensis TaxID=29808 RepID=A0AA38F9F0_TAXCH|nr:hypothetical protein KI387_040871 [Taxus chinensis]
MPKDLNQPHTINEEDDHISSTTHVSQTQEATDVDDILTFPTQLSPPQWVKEGAINLNMQIDFNNEEVSLSMQSPPLPLPSEVVHYYADNLEWEAHDASQLDAQNLSTQHMDKGNFKVIDFIATQDTEEVVCTQNDNQSVSKFLKLPIERVHNNPVQLSDGAIRIALVFDPSDGTSKRFSIPVVQELASQHLDSLPQRYIRSEKERPNGCPTNHLDIPIIDMGMFLGAPDLCRQKEMEKLGIACQRWGFFQAVNHGIPLSLMERMKGIVREFIQLPLEEKLKYEVQELEGYGQTFVVSNNQKLDWADTMYLTTLPLESRKLNLWPTRPLDFREMVDQYASEIQKLSNTVLCLLSENVGLKPDCFINMYGKIAQMMRLNYYPPCPRPDLALGISPHSDGSGLTVLLQDDETVGLQICKDGEWIPVRPIPGALVINIGDMLEVISNGRYKSIEHRAVTNSERDRISIAMFYGPEACMCMNVCACASRDALMLYRMCSCIKMCAGALRVNYLFLFLSKVRIRDGDVVLSKEVRILLLGVVKITDDHCPKGGENHIDDCDLEDLSLVNKTSDFLPFRTRYDNFKVVKVVEWVDAQLTIRDRIPLMLDEIREDLSDDDWDHLEAVGFGGMRFYRWIHRCRSLILALLERWNPSTNTFWLPTGEMTITLEDVHHITRLPVRGDPVYCISDAERGDTMQRLYGDEARGVRYSSRDFDYQALYESERAGCPQMTMMMLGISCFTLLDSGGGRFPWMMMGVVAEMMEQCIVFEWAPTLLAQTYIELWAWTTHKHYGIDVGFLLQCWAHEHIAIAHPFGLPSVIDVRHPGFMRWSVSLSRVRKAKGPTYYRDLISGLQVGDVIWWPYVEGGAEKGGEADEERVEPDAAIALGISKMKDEKAVVEEERDVTQREKALGITGPSISSTELSTLVRQRGASTRPYGMNVVSHYEAVRVERDYYVDMIIRNYPDTTLYVDHIASQGGAIAVAKPSNSAVSVGHPSQRPPRGDDGVGGAGGGGPVVGGTLILV